MGRLDCEMPIIFLRYEIEKGLKAVYRRGGRLGMLDCEIPIIFLRYEIEKGLKAVFRLGGRVGGEED